MGVDVNTLLYGIEHTEEPARIMVVKLEQLANASLPIIVATGNDTLVRLEQYLNAAFPIFVAAGNDTLVRLEQL